MKNRKLQSGSAIYRTCIMLFLLHAIVCDSFAQTKQVDSLRDLAYNTNSDTKKLPVLFELCEHSGSLHPDSLNLYCAWAYSIASKLKSEHDLLQINFYKATYFSKKGKLDSAINLIDSSLTLLQSKEEISLRFRFLILRSNVLIRSDKQKESIANSLKLLHDAEQVNDYYAQLRAKNNIGWAYMELGQNRDALNWFFEAMKLEKKPGNNEPQPYLYSNIAAVYNNIGINDSAEIFAKKALQYSIQQNDLAYIANAYFIYAGITNDLGEKVKTEQLLKKGVQIRKQIGDPFYIVSDIFQLGLFYANNNEPEKGIAVLKEGIDTAIKNNLYEKLPILYTSLARNYKTEGNMAKYAATLDTIIILKDSLYKKNSADALAEMQTKYDLQKKENTIIEQKYDLSRKNDLIFGSIAVLAATLLFGFFYLQNRKKNQQLKLQAIEMEQKKNTAQAVMQAEEQERKRIAGDLHDSVAQKMVVAKINIEALKKSLNGITEQQQKIIYNAQSLLDESTTEVRNLSHIMMPHALVLSGLADTVKNFLDKITQPGLAIHFNASGDFSIIQENTALMIYRIIQECVQNVLKHAKASKLDLSMIVENNELDVTIEDNGIGFNTEAAVFSSTSGMKNLRSRVEYLNGTLDINSNPGNGTIIAFYIPLHKS